MIKLIQILLNIIIKLLLNETSLDIFNFITHIQFLGEMVSKPTWGKDQPNNYNGEQNCVVLDGGRAWLWNDVGCNLDYLHWICQYRECHS